jgi:hypothetical protein
MTLRAPRPATLRARARLVLLGLFWPALAIAAIATAAQVADAIRNSPTANAFLKAHADEIGALAIAVESGGNTEAYNGSCCYGILQLSTTNIVASGTSVTAYRYASLQEQVDAWAKIESQALSDPVIAQLASMGAFDGQTVDAAMLIACVQLGQGNCRTMINSGSCNGFADSNGTTICSMAAKIDAAISVGGVAAPGTGASVMGTGSGSGGYSPTPNLAPDEAFSRGSGSSMSAVRDSTKLIAGGLFLIWLAWAASGSWGLFMNGRAVIYDITGLIARAAVIVLMVLWLLN